MERVKIDMPETFSFETELTVRISDINYGGHLSNDTLLSYLHEARVRYLEQFGFSEKDVCGAGLIMTDAAIAFKAQAFRGDALKIEISPAGFGKYGCFLLYRVSNRETGREIAHARTQLVTFDYEKGKMVPAPSEFRKKLESKQ